MFSTAAYVPPLHALKRLRLARRETLSTTLYIALTTLLIACSRGGDVQNEQIEDDSSGSTLSVALLTPGPISDQSWNGGAYAGLERIRDSLGARISHIQTRTPADFEENFRQYGTQHYSLVFGHGFEFQDAATRVAPDYPKTIYITTSGNTVGPNLAGMRFAFEEPSYLAGIIAGTMTKSNIIGVIGGTELPPVKASFNSFTAGAKAINPLVRVISSYIGNWDDVGAGKEQALAQISRGVDVIFQNADAAGLGVFQAARESRKALVIGSNSNQNSIAPEVTLGSVVIDLPHAFLSVARELQEKRFTPRVISLGAGSEVVKLILNPLLLNRIPAHTRAATDSIWALMTSGVFKVPGAMAETAAPAALR